MSAPYRFATVGDLESSTDRAVAWSCVAEALGPDRDRVLAAIDDHREIALRTCRPGHLTGSALVVEPSRGVALLMHHAKLRMWLQPGGHADGDTNLAAVALREAEEETGIEGLRLVVPAVDVDIHRVNPPTEDAHDHLDIRFVVVAPPGSEFTANHESTDMRWVTRSELADLAPEPGLTRLAERAFDVVAGLD